jgi:5-methylcytosine-specific restriction endonuclease McrA
VGYGYGSVYQRSSDNRWVAAGDVRVAAGEPRRRVVFTSMDREEAALKLAAYRADNPGFESEVPGERRDKMLHARSLGTHTQREWWGLIRSVKCVCAYCGVKTTVQNMTQDHIVPVCRGGSDAVDNLAVACASCNFEKGRMTGDEYRAWKAAR